MKKVFTFVLAMTIVVAGFAQIKSARPDLKQLKTAKAVSLSGFEERDYADFPAANRGTVIASDEIEMSQTYYDWQTNSAARNFTAVWPDGFAVVCFTQATDESASDRGTGLAIWDPALGEWEYTDSRVEGIRTGFGSIARYKENGLVVAAHTADELRIFIVEDFRGGDRDFGQGIALPMADGVVATHPAVQCSGENLDIIHVLGANFNKTTPYYKEAIFYWRYQNGEFTKSCELLPNLDRTHVADGGTNNYTFMLYNPAKPNRVSFMLNTPWADGKAVVSDDNGESWTDKVYYQHPGIDSTYSSSFMYPRWTSAEFDDNDNLHVVYEWNGTSGTAGDDGTYLPGVGGIGYWSEILPKNELCIGGIGNVGEPFIMDTTYLSQDVYGSMPWWSDANHDPLPESFGILQIIDDQGNVVSWNDTILPEVYYWVYNSDHMGDHGLYNCGIAAFPSMFMEGNNIYAFWSMLAGDPGEGDASMYYWDGTNHYFRLFGAVSQDGGLTWSDPVHLITEESAAYDEKVYGQVMPYLYHDAEGAYLWYVYQSDDEPGSFVQEDDAIPGNNFYNALKVYVSKLVGVEEQSDVVAPAINMTVFPNPANGSFNMELNNEADVNIFNAVGQLVKSYESVKSVKVTDLSAGIYFVKAGNQTQKVVVF